VIVSSTEPKVFHTLGKLSTRPESFGVDFLWTAERGLWGAQRKTYEDLVASVADDRLVKEVAQAEVLDHKVLVLEGRPTVMSSGDYLIGRREWTREQLCGLLWSLQAKDWWITTTTDALDTARVLRAMEVWSKKARHGSLERRGVKAKGVWGTDAGARGYGLWLLQGLPGVGPETAKAVWDMYGLPVRWTVGVEDLMKVPGVGRKTAERMFRALGGKADAEGKE